MKSNLWIAAIALLLVAGSSFTAARARHDECRHV